MWLFALLRGFLVDEKSNSRLDTKLTVEAVIIFIYFFAREVFLVRSMNAKMCFVFKTFEMEALVYGSRHSKKWFSEWYKQHNTAIHILCYFVPLARECQFFFSLDLISSSPNITYPRCNVLTAGWYEAAFTLPEMKFAIVCPISQFFN